MEEKQRLGLSLIKRIEKLIEEGIEITRLSQENDVIHLPKTEESDFYVWDIKDQYVIWKLECNQAVYKAGYHNSIFAESNSISLTSGTIMQMPINPTSMAGQKMLIDIRKETSRGLKFLREIINDFQTIKKGGLFETNENINNIEIKNENNYFSFNILTGDTKLNNININFKYGQQKFKIINTLINSEDYQSGYENIFLSLGWADSVISQRNLQNTINEIKHDLGILPKNNKSNIDIFKNIENFGYRLLLK